jgi:hypothetical protein
MIYKLCVTKSRIKYLTQQLGDNVVITNEGYPCYTVEVTINSDMDALCLFHAGIMAGLNEDNPVIEAN